MQHHRLGNGPVTAPGGGRGSPRPMHTQTDRRDPAAAGGAQRGGCLPASPPGSPRLVLPIPSLPAPSPSPSQQKGDRESQRCWLGDSRLRSPTASRSLVVLPPCSMRELKPRVRQGAYLGDAAGREQHCGTPAPLPTPAGAKPHWHTVFPHPDLLVPLQAGSLPPRWPPCAAGNPALYLGRGEFPWALPSELKR